MEFVLPPAWRALLREETEKPYWSALSKRVDEAYDAGEVFPPRSKLFSAFELTPPERVRVVILGQDPYHEPEQATGLAFSVRPGISSRRRCKISIRSWKRTSRFQAAKNGDLTSWARQGVFLLTPSFPCGQHRANATKDFGWQTFTDAVIAALGSLPQPIAFLLWGAQAQKKAAIIRQSPHPAPILESPHPSPLSAYRGFFGSRPFSQVNAFLLSCGFPAIDWKIPEDAQNTALGG